MKNSSAELSLIRRILMVSLFAIVLLTTGFALSCQSPAQAPPAPSPGLPEAPTPGTPPATPAQIEVAIEGFAFQPAEITVPVGTTVIWYNQDSVAHTVTAREGAFDSGNLANGDMFSYTFAEKGTFAYYCTLHPSMTGEVTIE